MTFLLNHFFRYLSLVVKFLFGDGCYASWQNLNEDSDWKVKGWPYHGRCWIHFGGKRRWSLKVSWNIWSRFCHAYVEADPSDMGMTAGIALPPIAFWISLEGIFPLKWMKSLDRKEVGLHVFDWAIWWHLWTPRDSWSSKTPKWRDGNWHFLDTLLGKVAYSKEPISITNVVVPMPEGAYPATVTLERATWKRPRWFARTRVQSMVNVPGGVPHQGKGENSYDCGEDATYGHGDSYDNVAEAIAGFVGPSLRSRQQYDGHAMARYPPAAERAARLEEERKQRELNPGPNPVSPIAAP